MVDRSQVSNENINSLFAWCRIAALNRNPCLLHGLAPLARHFNATLVGNGLGRTESARFSQSFGVNAKSSQPFHRNIARRHEDVSHELQRLPWTVRPAEPLG